MNIQGEFKTNQSFDLDQHSDSLNDSHDSDVESCNSSSATTLLDNSKKISKKRTKYQRIDDTLRKKLIDAVEKEGQMLKAAAKRFKINYSSAKSIFHTYRKEGRVNKKAVRERYGRKNMSVTKSAGSTVPVKSSALSSVKENFQFASENPLKLSVKGLDGALKTQDLFENFKMPNLSGIPMSLKNVLPGQNLACQPQFNVNQHQILNNFSQLQSLGLGQNLNMLQQQLHNISLLENLQKLSQQALYAKPHLGLMMGKNINMMSKEEQMYSMMARNLEAQKLMMGNPLQEFAAKPNLWSN